MRPLLFFIFNLTVLISSAQMDTLKVHRFNNGQLSTVELSNGRTGKAIAYNQSGSIIYERTTRKVAGSASVSFSYYPNGAVRKAIFYTAPDGGIQWERTSSFFSPKGLLQRELKEGDDWEKEIFSAPQEQVFCNPVHNNEMIAVNRSGMKVSFIITDRGISDTILLKQNDSLKIREYISAEITQKPEHFFTLRCVPLKKRRWLFFKNKKSVVWSYQVKTVSNDKTRYVIYLDPKK